MQEQIPTVLVILGATGDLMRKKIIPALFELYRHHRLPSNFQIIGFSRRSWTDGDFQAFVREHLTRGRKAEKLAFSKKWRYNEGDFREAKSYSTLRKLILSMGTGERSLPNTLYYLAVPPNYYEAIFVHLAQSKLTEAEGNMHWTRVVVEKPFGKDGATAAQLDRLLGKLFQEDQIYRIDHYLAKEMVQNILAFRFSNNLFARVWDKHSIEKIEIRLWETLGVEDRGLFYDGVGALRDVGQNHLLQLLALVVMQNPGGLAVNQLRSARARALRRLVPMKEHKIRKETFRAQYQGYRKIPDVQQTSETETYFKIRAFLDAPEWEGVPIILEGGKRMGFSRKEVVITFRQLDSHLPIPGMGEADKNKLIIRVEPEERIAAVFWAKKPGHTLAVERRELTFLLRKKNVKHQYVEEYEKLLVDALTGDQTLFTSTAEVAAMWQFIDPITKGWEKQLAPLEVYAPDSPEAAHRSQAISLGLGSGEKTTKEIGIVGLGKMGGNLALRLLDFGWRVVGYNRTYQVTQGLMKQGMDGVKTIKELVNQLPAPRVVWLMVPAGHVVDDILYGERGLVKYLEKGDVVIDGGNSHYTDSIKRAEQLKQRGITLIDVGFSGGPEGARGGACLMIGGDETTFQQLEYLFFDAAIQGGYQFFPGSGAGHFIKMIHNGIEYGMMQAIAEGFNLMRRSPYNLNLKRVARIFNHGSVIESRLMGWLERAYSQHGMDLEEISGTVGFTGEGGWTVEAAKKMQVAVTAIEAAVNFRITSLKKPSYTGKILSALRGQFGGHTVTINAKTKPLDKA